MLLEFSVSNHKSIRKRILFSALAGTDTSNEDLLIDFHGLRVLKSAVVYGANGSGKSNFVDSISFVKNLVTNSITHQPGQGIRQLPHKLESLSTDSVYSIQFVTNDIRYVYSFTLNNLLVKEEYLYYFPNGRQTKIFERTGESFVTGNKFRGKLSTCKDVLKPNRLLLSCAANFSSVAEIEDAYKFFRDELVIYSPGNGIDNWMDYSLHQINSNMAVKRSVIAFMQGLGIDVKDISITIAKRQLPADEIVLPDFLSDDFKKHILQETVNAITARMIYDCFDTDLLQEESTGVKKLFAFLCPLIDIMVKGKTLVCDEIENSLHESLVQGIIKLFMTANNNSYAQLLFTTHDTSLLDLDVFRRDQIWFTELDKSDRSTEIYSLAEIKNVRKDEKFGKGYISGRYGAIPMLNINFADVASLME